MSQYTYRHRDLAILTGWDRPLQRHFLVVEQLSPTRRTRGRTYSNLSDPDLPRGDMTPAQVISKLRQLKITYPAGLETNLVRDAELNAGNVTRDYGVL